MDINSLKCFIAVAEEQNITKAAKRLFLTQQTLSSTIRRLEDECQTPLFERKPSFRLTRAGELFLKHAKQIVNSENELHSALADIDRNCSATLRFGIPTLGGNKFFYPTWKKFHEMHPNVAVSLYLGRTQEFNRLISVGEISVFVGINAEQRNGYICKEAAIDHLACAVSLRLLQEYYPELTEDDMNRFLREGIDLAMLRELPCVRLRADAGRETSELEDLLYNASVECSHQGGMLPLIKNGVGYGFVFPYTLMDEANKPGGDLWMLPIQKKQNDFTICIVYRNQPLPDYLSDFIAIIEKTIAEYQEFSSKFDYSESFDSEVSDSESSDSDKK